MKKDKTQAERLKFKAEILNYFEQLNDWF